MMDTDTGNFESLYVCCNQDNIYVKSHSENDLEVSCYDKEHYTIKN